MSSLHSCHWDWCRFTTVLHEDFVQHVISVHIDKAEPVKRDDISLIRQVEQGASGHSGGIFSSAATSDQCEAPQSVSQPVGSTVSPQPPPQSLLSSHYQHVSEADHPVLSKSPNAPTMNRALSFLSGSTRILPVSSQTQQTTTSDSESQGVSQLELQTQAAYRSQSFE